MNPGTLAGVAISVAMFVGSFIGTAFDRPDTPAHDPAVIAATGVYVQAPSSPQAAPKPATPTTTPTPTGCAFYVNMARSVGWPETELATLGRVMHAESGCNPQAHGDQTLGDSLGLMQIHTDSWCEPNRYWPAGYLQTWAVLDDCRQLLDPFVNLYAALLVWREGGWTQWTTWQPS
jgi:hypothetical protein